MSSLFAALAGRVFGGWVSSLFGVGVAVASVAAASPELDESLKTVFAAMGLSNPAASAWAGIVAGVFFLLSKSNLGVPKMDIGTVERQEETMTREEALRYVTKNRDKLSELRRLIEENDDEAVLTLIADHNAGRGR